MASETEETTVTGARTAENATTAESRGTFQEIAQNRVARKEERTSATTAANTVTSPGSAPRAEIAEKMSATIAMRADTWLGTAPISEVGDTIPF